MKMPLLVAPFVMLLAAGIGACGQKKIMTQRNIIIGDVQSKNLEVRTFSKAAKLTKESQHGLAPKGNGANNNLFNRSF
ncbi:MAG: hypothetical protein WCR52_06055 [Bacteroidota bacterium]